MKKVVIGQALIRYTESGKVCHAEFSPSIAIKLTSEKEIAQKLIHIPCNKPETVKADADTLLGLWFAQLTDIELADRNSFEVISNIITCETYPSGNVKLCELEYVFQERESVLN